MLLLNTDMQMCVCVCILTVILNCGDLDIMLVGTQFFHLHDVGQRKKDTLLEL